MTYFSNTIFIHEIEQTCTGTVEAIGDQTAEGTVTLSWNPPCAGQLWMDGRLLEDSVLPPYVVTGLDPNTYTYGLFGRRTWAFSTYRVVFLSPFVASTSSPTMSPTATPEEGRII